VNRAISRPRCRFITAGEPTVHSLIPKEAPHCREPIWPLPPRSWWSEKPSTTSLSAIVPTSPRTASARPPRVTHSQHQVSERSTKAWGTWITTSSGLPRWTPPLNTATPVSSAAAPLHWSASTLLELPSALLISLLSSRCWPHATRATLPPPIVALPCRPGARWLPRPAAEPP
jgi:hypothetical protein